MKSKRKVWIPTLAIGTMMVVLTFVLFFLINKRRNVTSFLGLGFLGFAEIAMMGLVIWLFGREVDEKWQVVRIGLTVMGAAYTLAAMILAVVAAVANNMVLVLVLEIAALILTVVMMVGLVMAMRWLGK